MSIHFILMALLLTNTVYVQEFRLNSNASTPNYKFQRNFIAGKEEDTTFVHVSFDEVQDGNGIQDDRGCLRFQMEGRATLTKKDAKCGRKVNLLGGSLIGNYHFNATVLPFMPSMTMTISLWISIYDLPLKNLTIFSCKYDETSDHVILLMNYTHINFLLNFGKTGNLYACSWEFDNSDIVSKGFFHVAATYSSYFGEIRLYKNGKLVSHSIASGEAINTDMWIKGIYTLWSVGDKYTYIRGSMDDLYIINAAISSIEIKDLMGICNIGVMFGVPNSSLSNMSVSPSPPPPESLNLSSPKRERSQTKTGDEIAAPSLCSQLDITSVEPREFASKGLLISDYSVSSSHESCCEKCVVEEACAYYAYNEPICLIYGCKENAAECKKGIGTKIPQHDHPHHALPQNTISAVEEHDVSSCENNLPTVTAIQALPIGKWRENSEFRAENFGACVSKASCGNNDYESDIAKYVPKRSLCYSMTCVDHSSCSLGMSVGDESLVAVLANKLGNLTRDDFTLKVAELQVNTTTDAKAIISGDELNQSTARRLFEESVTMKPNTVETEMEALMLKQVVPNEPGKCSLDFIVPNSVPSRYVLSTSVIARIALKSERECVEACCQNPDCGMAAHQDHQDCYLISCLARSLCHAYALPLPEDEESSSTIMYIIRQGESSLFRNAKEAVVTLNQEHKAPNVHDASSSHKLRWRHEKKRKRKKCSHLKRFPHTRFTTDLSIPGITISRMVSISSHDHCELLCCNTLLCNVAYFDGTSCYLMQCRHRSHVCQKYLLPSDQPTYVTIMLKKTASLHHRKSAEKRIKNKDFVSPPSPTDSTIALSPIPFSSTQEPTKSLSLPSSLISPSRFNHDHDINPTFDAMNIITAQQFPNFVTQTNRNPEEMMMHQSTAELCFLRNSACSQLCIPIYDTYVCGCRRGFYLLNDGATCKAIARSSEMDPLFPPDLNTQEDQNIAHRSDVYYNDRKLRKDPLPLPPTLAKYKEHEEARIKCPIASYSPLQVLPQWFRVTNDNGKENMKVIPVPVGGRYHVLRDGTLVINDLSPIDTGVFRCTLGNLAFASWSDTDVLVEVNDWCATAKHMCDHECKSTITGYECLCRAGFVLSMDNRTCLDLGKCRNSGKECRKNCDNSHESNKGCPCVNNGQQSNDESGTTCLGGVNVVVVGQEECRTRGLNCEQLCTNATGRIECSCTQGYYLDHDKNTCKKDVVIKGEEMSVTTTPLIKIDGENVSLVSEKIPQIISLVALAASVFTTMAITMVVIYAIKLKSNTQ